MLFGIKHLVLVDDRLLCHPKGLDKRLGEQTACVQGKAFAIPLFMHAAWSWGGLFNFFSPLAGHFLTSWSVVIH